MSDLRKSDRVIFRQQAPDGYADDIGYDVLIDDGTAYQIHKGRIIEIDRDYAVVGWDDGEETKTPLEKLDSLEFDEAPEWYEPRE